MVAHNYYGDFATGGEGRSAEADVNVLREHGHEVVFYKKTNYELLNFNIWRKIKLPFSIIYSHETYNEVRQIIKEFKPDILHVHNYKYLFTPSIFKAAKDNGVKTVFTLRNFRLICPCALLCCNGKVCVDCLKGFPFRVLWKRCFPYENSLSQRILQLYFYLGTSKKVANPSKLIDAYIALTPFVKECFIKAGMSAKKIYIRPNFMDVPRQIAPESISDKIGAVYIGRISSEKGIDFLIDAWQSIDYPLTIVGTGPLEDEVKKRASSNVVFMGNLSPTETMGVLARSNFLVFPSVCYETFGRTIIEAFSLKVPVIASNLGPRKDLITHDTNGLLFDSLNLEDFKFQVSRLIDNPSLAKKIGEEGNKTFLDNYTPEINYRRLIRIYEDVLNDEVDGIDLISK